jgi:hypothetical protein
VSENKAYHKNDHYYAATEGGAAMTMTNANRRGRQSTPERLQQIRNLVERGKSREEIAELIGVTVGSLQDTCLRFGIGLLSNGMGLLRRGGRHSDNGTSTYR